MSSVHGVVEKLICKVSFRERFEREPVRYLTCKLYTFRGGKDNEGLAFNQLESMGEEGGYGALLEKADRGFYTADPLQRAKSSSS